ncbi:MAG: DUF3861 domain-containing protein [Lysobacter sp.]
MSPYRYRITVRSANPPATATRAPADLDFDVAHSDDLLAIVDKVRQSTGYDHDGAAALAVGLKLLSGAMREHRADPLFADLQPALRAFIGNLRARAASDTVAD